MGPPARAASQHVVAALIRDSARICGGKAIIGRGPEQNKLRHDVDVTGHRIVHSPQGLNLACTL